MSKPSISSKTRVFCGLPRSAVTSTRRVVDWILGTFAGSNKSRRRFMYISRWNRLRDGGCSSRIPWSRVKVESMRRSADEVWVKPNKRSRVVMRRDATVELSAGDGKVGWKRVYHSTQSHPVT